MIIYYADITGAISPNEKEGFLPVYEGEIPIPCTGQKVEQDKIIPCEGGYVMTYKLVDAPSYTAAEWLEMVGLGTAQQPTLIYLKLQLMAAQKISTKLTALEGYLNGILAQYAQDNSPKQDWGQPPYTIQETIAECVNLLQP